MNWKIKMKNQNLLKFETLDDCPTAEQLNDEVKRLRQKRNFRKVLLNTTSSLLVVCALAILISVLFMPVLRVTGQSMEPTFQNDQIVICAKNSNFKKGDVVAFYYNNKILLKRIIAEGGDVVKIDRKGNVFVNNVKIDEPYIKDKALGECNIDMPYKVPESRYFVMGDNRKSSIDSRSTSIGCISGEVVLGKIIFNF